MAGTITTPQLCPGCGGKYPTSKGGVPIECPQCRTQPTKFIIKIYWKGRNETISYSRDGQALHYFGDANTVLGGIRAEIGDGKKSTFDPEVYRLQSKTNFNQFWNRFRDRYKDKIGTYDKLRAIGRNHLDFFAEYQIRDIRAYHISDWWAEMRDKGLSPKYRNDILQWLKSFFLYAAAEDVIERVPKKYPEPYTEPEAEVEDWLTEDEQIQVLDKLPKHDQPIFDFLFLTGVRVNEATGLLRADTNWKKGITVIKHTRKRDGSLGIVKGKKKRIIPHAPDILECLRQSQKVSGLNKYQFTNRWGRPYSDDYLRDTFYGACDETIGRCVKLKNASRHSFGMWLLSQGYDIWEVSKIMGHSNIKMTENYAKMLGKEIASAYDRSRRFHVDHGEVAR